MSQKVAALGSLILLIVGAILAGVLVDRAERKVGTRASACTDAARMLIGRL